MAKIGFEFLLESIKTRKLATNVFLLSGNESGLISSLSKKIYTYFKKNGELGEILHLDQKKDKELNLKSHINQDALFSNTKFIIISNPSESLGSELEEHDLKNTIVVINGEKIKTSSRLKKYFDSHKFFLSISCYSLTRENKVKIINRYIKDNNIDIAKDAYWYLIENIDDNFLVLEKELEKILIYNSKLNLKSLKQILTSKNNTDLDEIFFRCALGDKKYILNLTSIFIRSSSDCYDILRNIKKFINILLLAELDKKNKNIDLLTSYYLPKYLFLKRNIFREIIKNNNSNKIFQTFSLIQKTEILLRQNSSQSFEITQRFLLNFSRIIK